MGMLDRYKKKGGFVQLLCLIESSGKAKQEQFLGLIAQESAVWEQEIRKKSLSLDKILGWNDVYLGEVLTRVQPLTLATAFSGLPKERVEKALACLGMSDKRKIQAAIDEAKPTPAEVSTCIMKIIIETRGMIQGGILKMDKVDPDMAIVDGIEENLGKAQLQKTLEGGINLSSPPPELGADGEPVLNFDGPNRKKDADHSHDHGKHADEVDFLKKKVNQLVSENNTLRQEVAVMRGKLDQIRKIA